MVKFPVSRDSQKTETDKDKAIQPHPPSEPALTGGERRVTEEKPEEIKEQDPLEIAKERSGGKSRPMGPSRGRPGEL